MVGIVRPVDQTTFGMPGGNCWSACVASLLELPIEDVPYFLDDWPEKFNRWIEARGFYAVTIADERFVPGGYCIIGGHSPRGIPHAVVGCRDRIVHDPHPSREGLVVREDCTLLIPIDPARQCVLAAAPPPLTPATEIP